MRVGGIKSKPKEGKQEGIRVCWLICCTMAGLDPTKKRSSGFFKSVFGGAGKDGRLDENVSQVLALGLECIL